MSKVSLNAVQKKSLQDLSNSKDVTFFVECPPCQIDIPDVTNQQAHLKTFSLR